MKLRDEVLRFEKQCFTICAFQVGLESCVKAIDACLGQISGDFCWLFLL